LELFSQGVGQFSQGLDEILPGLEEIFEGLRDRLLGCPTRDALVIDQPIQLSDHVREDALLFDGSGIQLTRDGLARLRGGLIDTVG
jgi:hypothetical protein